MPSLLTVTRVMSTRHHAALSAGVGPGRPSPSSETAPLARSPLRVALRGRPRKEGARVGPLVRQERALLTARCSCSLDIFERPSIFRRFAWL